MTTARGFPVNGLEVNTSRVVNFRDWVGVESDMMSWSWRANKVNSML